MLAVVAGAAGLAVVVAAAGNGADRPELADAVNSGSLGSCSFPFWKSCRSLIATWYSSCSHYPCPFASCSNSAAEALEPAFGNIPAAEQCSYGGNYPSGSWR